MGDDHYLVVRCTNGQGKAGCEDVIPHDPKYTDQAAQEKQMDINDIKRKEKVTNNQGLRSFIKMQKITCLSNRPYGSDVSMEFRH